MAESNSCFRCKDLAVIDKSVFKYLPGVLNRAAELLGDLLTYEDEYEVANLKTSLRQYAVLLESIPDD